MKHRGGRWAPLPAPQLELSFLCVFISLCVCVFVVVDDVVVIFYPQNRSLLDSAQPFGKRRYRLVTRVHPRTRRSVTTGEVFGKAWPLFSVVLNLSDCMLPLSGHRLLGKLALS